MAETQNAAGVVTAVVDKLGQGADRIITDVEKFATEFIRRVDSIAPQIAADIRGVLVYMPGNVWSNSNSLKEFFTRLQV